MANRRERRIKRENYVSEDQNEVKHFIIILAIVIIGILAVYLLTRIFVTKDLFNNKESSKTSVPGEVNYNITLIGSMLNLPEEEYYVMITDTSVPESIYYNNIMTTYAQNEDALKVYLADLDNELNKSYISDQENLKTSDLTKFKVKGTTLVKVKKGKVEETFTADEKIVEELKYVAKEETEK